MNRKICIIPARGGSKRIPQKNIKNFLGKPIIAYSIEAAVTSRIFDEVMVSTEDEEIATIAKEFGAEVPFMRSVENANDTATTIEVILEVLSTYKRREQLFDFGCCLYPTAPFVNCNLLQSTFQLLRDNNYDSCFPILKYSSPIQRSLKMTNENKVEMFYPEHLNSRSQDLEAAYHDAGQYYWFKTNAIEEKKNLWTNNSGYTLLSELDAHDIDNPEDWKVAEFKYNWSLKNE
ncbi:UNVERIFIED_CONTAM: hypothetical protein GTU68_039650 [Idotea baltica]|nr:hypothetical protein [Idotea baltica]